MYNTKDKGHNLIVKLIVIKLVDGTGLNGLLFELLSFRS